MVACEALEEAAVLQGFPPDYPFHRAVSRTRAFGHVADTVPPPLAVAMLAALIPTGVTP